MGPLDQDPPREGRASPFEQVLGLGLPVLLLLACLLIVAPFIPALVWSAIIVVTLWRPLEWLAARLGGRRRLVALLLALAMLALVVGPAVSLAETVASGLPQLRGMAGDLLEAVPREPPKALVAIPLLGERVGETWRTLAEDAGAVADLAERVGPGVARWLLARLAGIGETVLQFLLVAATTAVLYAQGRPAAEMAERLALRLGGAEGREALEVATRAIRAVSAGVVGTAAAQAILAAVGFAAAGVPGVPLLGLGVLVFGIIQIGPLPMWAPVVLWLYHTGETLTATLLLVWSLGVVQTVDNFLRPMLISRGARLPLLLMLIGVLGGLLAIGLIGVFLGPTLLGVGYVLLRRWLGMEVPGIASAPEARGR